MAGKTVIAIVAALGMSAITGVALGQFAVTQPKASEKSFAIADHTGNPDAAYGPSPSVITENARLNEGASIAPVCKGCGPTLAQRREKAYFGDDYKSFEESATEDNPYSEGMAQPVDYAPEEDHAVVESTDP